ncbi:TerB N-terminal domain-containing protein [Paratractidigestivibacter sp.]|uniref:TerB N-terminal domain-containing protein n=1 Tax=Paratractidigestivibacter sp. TaxID=2847316 RepID=UPI002ABE0569|nr:TerB N-terminal domain-containing protein [Paratractidigestivibacter sp.]
MADIDKILEQLLSDPRLRTGRAFSSAKSYGDEPIIRRGSQMHGFVPEPIKRLRELQTTPTGRAWSETRLFYEQARLLEDFEDHAPYTGQFLSYYPTYRSMNDRQLRGYFTWRANVRRGQIEDVSTSFAYVYIYELLMGIGVEPGTGGFEAIQAFYQAYRTFDQASMDRNVRPWLVDYVVDHGLDPKLATPYADTAHDGAIALLEGIDRAAVLSAPPKGSRREALGFGTLAEPAKKLMEAAAELSTYRITESKLYKDAPDDLELVFCAVFIRLARHYARTHNQGLTETLFGTRFAVRHLMYASAIHYDPAPHEDCVFELSPTRRYVCRQGNWTCEGYHDGGAKSAKLGDICRAVDRQLRAALDYPAQLKDHAEPKYLVKMIDAEIVDYLAYKEAHRPIVIDIDLSKLAGIRSAAAVTQEALLVDEERDEGTPSGAADLSSCSNSPDSHGGDIKPPPAHAELLAETSSPAAPSLLAPESTPSDGTGPYGLSQGEVSFLWALLKGNKEELIQGAGKSVDLVVDAVNEKLFDLLGDTAVEFGDDGTPQLVEDYAGDVRDVLEQ